MDECSSAIVGKIAAAGGQGREVLCGSLEEFGLERAADIVLHELAIRCNPVSVSPPEQIAITLRHEGEYATGTISIGPDGASVIRDVNTDCMRVEFDAVELLLNFFGPENQIGTATPNVDWKSLGSRLTQAKDTETNQSERIKYAFDALLVASTKSSESLKELSVLFGSDKWGPFHWYAQHYERHFRPLRYQNVNLLEIGIGGYEANELGGASLRMWQRYFPRGLIYGLDIIDKPRVSGPRIQCIQGDQSDGEFLDQFARKIGPFDIVIDDGSHINEHTRSSFYSLFPHVRRGGLYVIEDLQTSYWPTFGGTSENFTDAENATGMLKSLIDGLHHEEIRSNRQPKTTYIDEHTIGIHIYHNLAVIEKGNNEEGSIVEVYPSLADGQ